MVVEQHSDQTDSIPEHFSIRFAHLPVLEYLEETQFDKFDANVIAAETCLLLLMDKKTPLSSGDLSIPN